MTAPRIAAIHDLRCLGRCALTVALPVLSAMGCQCCPLPTALLSAHTGFPEGVFLELTDPLRDIAAHWTGLDVPFRAVYTGFLGTEEQARCVAEVWRTLPGEEKLLILDPVLGDRGQPYRTCTPALCREMKHLAEAAHLITPNLTEAALLLETPYREILEADPRQTVQRLSLEGRRSVVLTGYSADPAHIGALCYDRRRGTVHVVQARRIPLEIHGTGDVFASVLTGALALGKSLFQAAQQAADFTALAVEKTAQAGTPEVFGLEFESCLWALGRGGEDALPPSLAAQP